jgi:hypothetical protein
MSELIAGVWPVANRVRMAEPAGKAVGDLCAGQTGDRDSRKPGEIVLPWAVMRRSWFAAERELVAASGAGWFAFGNGDTG